MSNGAIFFPAPPQVIILGKGRYEMAHDYVVPIELPNIKGSLCVAAGFLTDLASVPRPVRIFIDRTELGGAAPIAHDWLYQHGGCFCPDQCLTRSQTDRVFQALMRAEGASNWKRLVAWMAVRLAGWACWHRNKVIRNALAS